MLVSIRTVVNVQTFIYGGDYQSSLNALLAIYQRPRTISNLFSNADKHVMVWLPLKAVNYMSLFVFNWLLYKYKFVNDIKEKKTLH